MLIASLRGLFVISVRLFPFLIKVFFVVKALIVFTFRKNPIVKFIIADIF